MTIFDAIKINDLRGVKELIENVNSRDNSGMTPLHWALRYGDQEIKKYLIDKGTNLNLQDKSGMTPLHWALRYDDQEITKYLIDKGANLNLQDNYKMTPLQWAVRVNNPEIAAYLRLKGLDTPRIEETKDASDIKIWKHNFAAQIKNAENVMTPQYIQESFWKKQQSSGVYNAPYNLDQPKLKI